MTHKARKTRTVNSGGAFFFACLLSLLIPPLGFSAFAETLTDKNLIEALRSGGYHIYFRHEATDWSQDDYVNQRGDWTSCDGSRIRQLSDSGRQRAKATGQAMKQLNIPIGPIWASPYCRTMETARLLGLGSVTATDDVINMRVAQYFGGRSEIVKTARKLLSASLPKGKNSIIVAHGNVARESTPVYPGEGEAVIFKPDEKGGFQFAGRLTPQQWSTLARQLSPSE